jgi:hypothetical protein
VAVTESRPDGHHKRRVVERLVEVSFESRRSRRLMVGLADQAADRDDGYVLIRRVFDSEARSGEGPF